MNILITGASKGIGKAIALAFCKNGNHALFLVSRDEKLLKELKNQCNALNSSCSVKVYPFDLGETGRIKNLVEDVLSETDTIDILINNAGILYNKKFDAIREAEIQSSFNINFFAPATLIKLLIPSMSKPAFAHVINIGSMGGYQGSSKYPGLSFYSASKGAIAILTECLAEEYKNSGITFNCLALGAVQTEMFSEAFPGARTHVTPTKMADYIVDFAINSKPGLNGKIIPVLL